MAASFFAGTDVSIGQVPVPPEPLPNVLVIVADDLGVDRVASYGFVDAQGNSIAAATPTIDALAAEGIQFRNAWANPFCSPTRATCMSGRYSFRTGIGHFINQSHCPPTDFSLDPTLTAIPEILPSPYRRAAIGKWHLSACSSDPANFAHPLATGFDIHAGSFANIRGQLGQTYEDWPKIFSSSQGAYEVPHWTEYATRDTTDDAIRVIDAFDDDPWFLWVAYNAPHVPLHKPPADLYPDPIPGTPTSNPIPHFKAMVEVLDGQIDRLLDSIPANVRARTTIIFLGDNGTVGDYTELPFNPTHGKSTVFNGGVNVPLIVSGPSVAPEDQGSECDALVNTTDLFATVAEITGGDGSAGIDSISFAPYLADPGLTSIREWIFAEEFDPNFGYPGFPGVGTHRTAIREETYKLIRKKDGTELFFNVVTDYFESDPITNAELTPAEAIIKQALSDQLDALLGS